MDYWNGLKGPNFAIILLPVQGAWATTQKRGVADNVWQNRINVLNVTTCVRISPGAYALKQGYNCKSSHFQQVNSHRPSHSYHAYFP